MGSVPGTFMGADRVTCYCPYELPLAFRIPIRTISLRTIRAYVLLGARRATPLLGAVLMERKPLTLRLGPPSLLALSPVVLW